MAEVKSLAQRKAERKRKQQAASEAPVATTEPIIEEKVSVEVNPVEKRESEVAKAKAALRTQMEQKEAIVDRKIDSPVSKDELMKMARSMGLELSPPKIDYVRQTFAIRPEHKDMIPEYTKALGMKTQDFIGEALDMIFEKYQAQFESVKRAKDFHV